MEQVYLASAACLLPANVSDLTQQPKSGWLFFLCMGQFSYAPMLSRLCTFYHACYIAWRYQRVIVRQAFRTVANARGTVDVFGATARTRLNMAVVTLMCENAPAICECVLCEPKPAPLCRACCEIMYDIYSLSSAVGADPFAAYYHSVTPKTLVI